MAIANSSGAVQERYLYSAYGQTVVLGHASLGQFAADEDNVSDVANDVVYTGRLSDSETGLHYYRNRYLDARLGRFVNRDPLKIKASSMPLMMHLYEYCDSAATHHLDPYGLYTLCCKYRNCSCDPPQVRRKTVQCKEKTSPVKCCKDNAPEGVRLARKKTCKRSAYSAIALGACGTEFSPRVFFARDGS